MATVKSSIGLTSSTARWTRRNEWSWGAEIFNAYTERAYVMPVAPIPTQFVHRKEIRIDGGTLQTPGVMAGNFSWQ